MGEKIYKFIKLLCKHEIDFRIESDFCCGYIFYFLDGSIYPRRYYDHELEHGEREKMICESVDHVVMRFENMQLQKDWEHRIHAPTLEKMFELAEEYAMDVYLKNIQLTDN